MSLYYLSGKISDGGDLEPTFGQFYQEEERLQNDGHLVFNPARMEIEGGATWEWYLVRDLLYIQEHKPIMLMLKGWEESRGARLEKEWAGHLGLTVEFI